MKQVFRTGATRVASALVFSAVRRKTRKAQPVKVGGLIRDVLERMAGPDRVREAEAVLAWEQVVGPTVAARTEAERVVGGTLIVRVASSAYANELAMCKRDILAKLAAHVGGAPITDLRFHVGERIQR